MELIINTDDFGLTKGKNQAIKEAYLKGGISSTTALVSAPAIDDAVIVASEIDVPVGIHLALDAFSCLSHNKKMCDDNNIFNRGVINPDLTVEEIMTEWQLQIDLFVKLFGKIPSHIDSHHHVHLDYDHAKEACLLLADKYDIPVRGLNGSVVIDQFYNDQATLENLKTYILSLQNKQVRNKEIMVHNAFVDQDLYDLSSYNDKRLKEHLILTSDEFISFLNDNDIKLVGFK